MTKKELIDALKDIPDTDEIVISTHYYVELMDSEEFDMERVDTGTYTFNAPKKSKDFDDVWVIDIDTDMMILDDNLETFK